MMTPLLQIPSFLEVTLSGLAVIGVLLLLAGVKELMHHDIPDQNEEARKLRDDVKNEKKVITVHSLFHQFLSDNFPRRK